MPVNVLGDRTAAVYVLTASLHEDVARAALAAELRHQSTATLVLASRLFGEDRDAATAQLRLNKVFEHAAEAIELGASAVEINDDRYEVMQATSSITTPADREYREP